MKTTSRGPLTPEQQIEKMLEKHTFEELLARGDLFDVTGAAKKTGFSEYHIRRLCESREIGHIVRNGSQRFFLPWQLRGVFKSVSARA